MKRKRIPIEVKLDSRILPKLRKRQINVYALEQGIGQLVMHVALGHKELSLIRGDKKIGVIGEKYSRVRDIILEHYKGRAEKEKLKEMLDAKIPDSAPYGRLGL